MQKFPFLEAFILNLETEIKHTHKFAVHGKYFEGSKVRGENGVTLNRWMWEVSLQRCHLRNRKFSIDLEVEFSG